MERMKEKIVSSVILLNKRSPFLIQMAVNSYKESPDYWNKELNNYDMETMVCDILDDLSQQGKILPGLHGDNIDEDSFDNWLNRYVTSNVINGVTEKLGF